MSIAIHKEFIREINVEPTVRYTIFSKEGTVDRITETEARFLYQELGALLEIDKKENK